MLACGRAALAGNLAPGTQLQRVDISLAEFPTDSRSSKSPIRTIIGVSTWCNLIASGVEDGAGNPMTLALFASLVTAQLLALPQIAVAG